MWTKTLNIKIRFPQPAFWVIASMKLAEKVPAQRLVYDSLIAMIVKES